MDEMNTDKSTDNKDVAATEPAVAEGVPTEGTSEEETLAEETPVEDTPKAEASTEEVPPTGDPSGADSDDQKKNVPSWLKYAIPGAIAVVVLICIMVASGKAYQKPITKLVKAVNSYETNIDKLVDAAMPGFVVKSYKQIISIVKKNDDVKDAIDNLKDTLGDGYDELEDEYGKGWGVKFDLSGKKKMDSDDCEEAAERYEDLYKNYLKSLCREIDDMDKYDIEDMADELDISEKQAEKLCRELVDLSEKFDEAKVSKGYTVKGRLLLVDKKGKTQEKTDKIEFNVIKLNGDWTIDYLSVMDSFGMSVNSILWEIEDLID